jgi:hypothetical protein
MMDRMKILLSLSLLLALATQTENWVRPIESSNMRIIGHSDLNGRGNGGEGLALTQYPDGRRILFLAHESAPVCFSVVDVTNTAAPKVITQVNTVTFEVRCNSLGLWGNTLIVANQTPTPGIPNAGMRIYDVSNPADPKLTAVFDTSGPYSRGVHAVGYGLDGRYAYLATGARDFRPANPNDDQFLMIVDVSDPRRPREVGRWWLPGMREGEPPLPRLKIDNGYRLHTLLMDAKKPNRGYAGWIDGGVVILDMTDRTRPKFVSRISWYPQEPGFLHTALPLVERGMLVTSEESTEDNCLDWPKRIRLVDMRDELKMNPLVPSPAPSNLDDLCKRGGRFGAHNIQPNRPGRFSKTLTQTVIGAFFNGGVRIYSITDPNNLKEIGYLVPAAPPGNPPGTIQINDVYIDEKGIIYANDRFRGGLYILEYTGSVPLN